jgi:ribosome-associated protein
MQNVGQSIADYFIICHADTDRQVDAIANNIIDEIKEELNITPWHKEGFENSNWILIDYANIIVHVFLRDQREFFNLEDLWADGEFVSHKEI